MMREVDKSHSFECVPPLRLAFRSALPCGLRNATQPLTILSKVPVLTLSLHLRENTEGSEQVQALGYGMAEHSFQM